MNATRSFRTSRRWSIERVPRARPWSGCSTRTRTSNGEATAGRSFPSSRPPRSEPLIAKSYGDAFAETSLEPTLAELDVGGLLVAGAQTDQCIRATLHSALVRGYDVTLVRDAHTTEDNTSYGAPSPELVIEHTNLYWTYEEAPGRSAGTAASAEVEFPVA